MNKYIFLTDEGYTYQANSISDTPDCENSQVLGIIEAENENRAFQKLIEENAFLLETNFEEIYSYKLDINFERKDFKIGKM